MDFLEYTRLNAILHVVLISVGVFGIEVSAQAALQDGTVVAELTVQIPSVSSFCHSVLRKMACVKLLNGIIL